MQVMVPLSNVHRPVAPPTSTPPSPIPAILKGKILFLSDLSGSEEAYAINSDGTGGWQLTESWPYFQADGEEAQVDGGRLQAFVQGAGRKTDIFYHDAQYGVNKQASFFPVWVK
jgi:hypothetical protein